MAKTPRETMIAFRIPSNERDAIDEAATRERRSRSMMARILIQEAILARWRVKQHLRELPRQGPPRRRRPSEVTE